VRACVRACVLVCVSVQVYLNMNDILMYLCGFIYLCYV
jgi:hypothetical protein